MERRKIEACSLEGQAKQLRERVQLMADAEGKTRQVGCSPFTAHPAQHSTCVWHLRNSVASVRVVV